MFLTFYQAWQQPVLQGKITYNEPNNNGSGFWSGLKQIGGFIGQHFVQTQFDRDYQAIQNMPMDTINTFGEHQPLGNFKIPDVYQPQPIQRRVKVKPYQRMNWDQPPQVTRQQRLNSIGHVIQQNNPNNRFNQNHRRGKFESGMIQNINPQEPQPSLMGNISSGISSFISPSAYGASRSNNSIRQIAQAQLNEFQQQQAMKKAQEEQSFYSQAERLIQQHVQQHLNIKPHYMPNMVQPGNQKAPLIQQFEQGVPFTNKVDWQNFVHKMRLEYYDRLRHQGQSVADRFEEQIIAKTIENLTGPHALRHKDGYVVIGNKAYGTAEAREKAEEFIEYLLEHDTYPPLKYPTTPNLPKEQYPDVTEKFNKVITNIIISVENISRRQGRMGIYPLFINSFPNNHPFDLQVNHYLPGQVIKDKNIKFDKEGFVVTTDQYALLSRKIVKAGYLSNYAYGYIVAAAGLSWVELFGAPLAIGDKNYDFFQDTNWHDNMAIWEGYQAYSTSRKK